MQNLSIIRFITVLMMLFTSLQLHAQDAVLKHVDVHAFSDLLAQYADQDNVHIIDVRTPQEFHAGHIEGAKVIDFYDKGFREKLKSLDKEATYLVYCRSGNRSGKTLHMMKQLGFQSAYNMKGGMKAWIKMQYPVVK